MLEYELKPQDMRPKFLEGIARIADFSNLLNDHYKKAINAEDADMRAISSDWRAVGEDIFDAYEAVVQEQRD